MSCPPTGRTSPAPAAPGLRPTSSIDPTKVVRLMLAFFGDSELPQARPVAEEAIPQPYRALLAHCGHMTEVLQRHHGGTLAVQPYRVHRVGDLYGRRIDLFVRDSDGAIAVAGPVMTGIVIFNLALVAPAVRDEILSAQTPLGEILIRRRILRRVTPDAFLAFDARDPLLARFGLPRATVAYGRLATIDCDRRPAADLLEIVRP